MFDLSEIARIATDTPLQTKTLSGSTQVLILTALAYAETMTNWANGANELTPDDKDDIDRMVSLAIEEISFGW